MSFLSLTAAVASRARCHGLRTACVAIVLLSLSPLVAIASAPAAPAAAPAATTTAPASAPSPATTTPTPAAAPVATTVPATAPAAAEETGSSAIGELMGIVLPLVLIIVVLLAVLYLVRRRFGLTGQDAPLSVLQILPLGPRERLVLVRSRSGRIFTVGVAAQSVTLVTHLDAADLIAPVTASPSPDSPAAPGAGRGARGPAGRS